MYIFALKSKTGTEARQEESATGRRIQGLFELFEFFAEVEESAGLATTRYPSEKLHPDNERGTRSGL